MKVFCFLLPAVFLVFSGCKRMSPEFFQGSAFYSIDEHGRESLRLQGLVMESAWGVSSIEETRYADSTDVEVNLRWRGNGAVDRTIDVTDKLRVTLGGKEIWVSEPYRKAFMTGDSREYERLRREGVPLPETFVKIPPSGMRRRALRDKDVPESEIDRIDSLLELAQAEYGITGWKLKILNGKPLSELPEWVWSRLLCCSFQSGTAEGVALILDDGVEPDHNFFRRGCSLGRTCKKGVYWRYGEKYEGELPAAICASGVLHFHGLVHGALAAGNLAAAELLIKRGAPYSEEDKAILEKMREEGK